MNPAEGNSLRQPAPLQALTDLSSLKTSLWLALLVLFFYLLSYAGIPHSIDELATISASESLLRGSLQLNRMEWEQERYPPQNAPGTDGNLYSKKGFGSSLLVLPFLLIGKQLDAFGAVQFAFLSTALLTAATVFFFYHLAINIDAGENVARIAAIALGLGTMLWPYAKMLFSEPLAALGLTLALLGLVRYSRDHKPLWLLLTSVGLGLCALARSANAIFAAPCALFVVYELLSVRKHRTGWRAIVEAGIFFTLPLAAIVLAIALVNYVRFGTYLSFPTVPGESFSTPLHTGILGLLWSPGKGLFFYVPLAWAMILSFVVDFRRMLKPHYLVALSLIVLPLIFYGRWYDWAGGKAWGPRFLLPSIPALVMLCLPAFAWLRNPHGGRWRRWFLILIVSFSIAAQLPGVLVNFEYQENLDAIPFQQLVWQWRSSPLITFWNDLFSSASDPVWLHPFFWSVPRWSLILFGVASVALLILHIREARRACHGTINMTRRTLLAAALLTSMMGISLVAASHDDIRWRERTETFSSNQATRAWIEDKAGAGDIVVLDLMEGYDKAGRVWEWINYSGLEPDYIGWRRKPNLSKLDRDRLLNWLSGYDRVWLVMQATAKGDPTSTTERWLRSWAYEGRTEQIDGQRIVEFLTPHLAGATIASGSATWSVPTTVPLNYQVQQGKLPDQLFFSLSWEQNAPTDVRFSVQVLDEQAQLQQQFDDIPTTDTENRIGMQITTAPARVVIKLYDLATGQVFPAQLDNGEWVELVTLLPIP